MTKKLIFAPLFLVLVTSLLFLYKPILDQYLDVFFRPYGGLLEFATLGILVLLASLVFALFVTFTQEIKLTLILGVFTFAIPFVFLKTSLAVVLGLGLVISLILTYFNLQMNLKTYVNFSPSTLLLTPIKMLNTFILLTLAVGFLLHTNHIIQTQGFKVPETLIDWAVDLSLKGQGPPVLGKKYLAQLPTLTEDQLNLLRQNPQILEQYGPDPKDLEQFDPQSKSQAPNSPNQNATSITPSLSGINLKDIIKAQMTTMLDELIKPYLFAIPFILAFMFYSLTSLLTWLFSLLLSPTITLIFYILEKSGFIKFEKELREVKKIVI